MNSSIDILSDLNPAYCSAVIYSFARGYSEESGHGVEFPLLILPIPVILSKSYENSFNNTNKNTGFFSWVDKIPEFSLELPTRIEGCLELTQDAIQYGIARSILTVTEQGELVKSDVGLRKQLNFPSKTIVGQSISHALRLGQWLGQIDSPTTVFNHLGLEI